MRSRRLRPRRRPEPERKIWPCRRPLTAADATSTIYRPYAVEQLNGPWRLSEDQTPRYSAGAGAASRNRFRSRVHRPSRETEPAEAHSKWSNHPTSASVSATASLLRFQISMRRPAHAFGSKNHRRPGPGPGSCSCSLLRPSAPARLSSLPVGCPQGWAASSRGKSEFNKVGAFSGMFAVQERLFSTQAESAAIKNRLMEERICHLSQRKPQILRPRP